MAEFSEEQLVNTGGKVYDEHELVDRGTTPSQAPTETWGQYGKRAAKTIGQHAAVTAAGTAPAIAGAEMGGAVGLSLGGPPGALAGGVVGAGIGGLAIPAFEYAASRVVGLEAPVPTYAQARHSAVVNAAMQMGAPVAQVLDQMGGKVLEHILGIGGASEAIGGAAGAQAKAATELTTAKRAVETKALGEMAKHDKATADAENAVSEAQAKASAQRTKDIEAARPAAQEQIIQRQAQQMVGKTPVQFRQQEAAPYEQQAAARSGAIDPVFDAATNFHQEVGAKFEPYIGKVRNDPASPAALESLGGKVTEIDTTLGQRGQRLQSAELKSILKNLRGGTEASLPDDYEISGTTLGKLRETEPERAGLLEQQILKHMKAQGEGPPTLTYGQLWGYRARANAVLASSRNPADRWAANEIVSEITNHVPGVPDAIRNQYAFERTLNRSVMSSVASARTPQEVGDAIFGSKAKPEPASVPLSFIRFTQQHNPEGMDGLRQAFADHYLGNRMTGEDLAKMNPAVLRELYGDKADSVVRLLGPEGTLKQSSWGELIRADPQAKAMLDDAIAKNMSSRANLEQQKAIVEGKRALAALPPKYDYVKRAFAAADTPEKQIQVLSQQLPSMEQFQRDALKELKPGRIEGYMGRRLAFMAAFAAMGAYGQMSKRPGLVTASIIMTGALGVRAGARWALSTENGASVYMNLLDMRAARANIPAFGRGLAAITSAAIVHGMSEHEGQFMLGDQTPSPSPGTPLPAPAPPPGSLAGRP